jgi:tetratricopeptide (TPR) repeat protein
MGFSADKSESVVQPQGEADAHITAAIEYLRQGFDAQAFLLLSDPRTERYPAARFALGLCRLRAGESDAAIICFEQALRLIKAIPSPPPEASENSETYLRLFKKQIENKFYLTPMDSGFCARFPKLAGQTVLLALIHTYRQKGMTDQAQKLASGLIGPVFEAYKIELNEDVSRGNT